jgi:methionyl-tRNA formyltransferase
MNKIRKILFIGSKKLGYEILAEMLLHHSDIKCSVVTIDDHDDGRSYLCEYIRLAKDSKIELHVARSRKESEKIIRKIMPDLCIVAGWYWIIGSELLSKVPFGFIGVHYSLLPKYRGGSPLVWQIINGEKTVGVTIFKFNTGIDDGPVLDQQSVNVDINEDISLVLTNLEHATLKSFRRVYPQILSQSIILKDQNHDMATYCAPRSPCDGVIDWSANAEDIHNFIRAQSHPYPGAYSHYDGQKVIICKAKMFDKKYFGTAGQVVKIENNEVYVVCGDNRAIILTQVEIGSKRTLASDVIISTRLRFT